MPHSTSQRGACATQQCGDPDFRDCDTSHDRRSNGVSGLRPCNWIKYCAVQHSVIQERAIDTKHAIRNPLKSSEHDQKLNRRRANRIFVYSSASVIAAGICPKRSRRRSDILVDDGRIAPAADVTRRHRRRFGRRCNACPFPPSPKSSVASFAARPSHFPFEPEPNFRSRPQMLLAHLVDSARKRASGRTDGRAGTCLVTSHHLLTCSSNHRLRQSTASSPSPSTLTSFCPALFCRQFCFASKRRAPLTAAGQAAKVSWSTYGRHFARPPPER